MSQVPKVESPKILKTASFEQGFHFKTEKGVYTGMTAISLSDFESKLETVGIDSVNFHYPRGDFQKWIQDILGDEELANRMCFTQPNASGEKLRSQLIKIIQKRMSELKLKEATT